MGKRRAIPQECKVDSVPPYVRAKITEFKDACELHAFRGSYSPKESKEIEQALWASWYNLEQTIATAINSPSKGTEQKERNEK